MLYEHTTGTTDILSIASEGGCHKGVTILHDEGEKLAFSALFLAGLS